MMSEHLIWAGETPLACTIDVEQTAPLTLTVYAGTFTTIGKARVYPFMTNNLKVLLADGRAELTRSGQVRVWAEHEIIHGVWETIERSRTYALARDCDLDVPLHPTRPREYQVILGMPAQETALQALLQQRQWDGNFYLPPGWDAIAVLVLPFTVPPHTRDLAGLPIDVMTVLPGYPHEAEEEAYDTTAPT